MGEHKRRIMAQESMPYGEEAVTDPIPQQELVLARNVAKILVDKYPGPHWSVRVDIRGGIMGIQLPEIMKADAFYIIKNDDVANEADLLRTVRNAGGELLERFGLRRGIVTLDELRDRRARLPLILPEVPN